MTRIAIVFTAGFLAVLLGHQPMVAALNALGVIHSFPTYSFDPVPPLGVPSVISKAFWGGLWAILLDLVLARTSGATYWVGWTVLGVVALSLVAIFVVPVVKACRCPRLPIACRCFQPSTAPGALPPLSSWHFGGVEPA